MTPPERIHLSWRQRLRQEVRREGADALAVGLCGCLHICLGVLAWATDGLAWPAIFFALAGVELLLAGRQAHYWRRLRIMERNS